MNFDLRFPIGLLFSFYGVVLILYGVMSNPQIYERSLGININLNWGIVLFIFGATMLMLAVRSRPRKR